MKQYRKALSRKENFILWEKYQLMSDYKKIVITFIDNNILNDEPEQFKEVFGRYKEASEDFYLTIEKIYKEVYKTRKKKVPFLQWEIDFLANKLLLTVDEEQKNEFDSAEFSLNFLELLPAFRSTVENIIK